MMTQLLLAGLLSTTPETIPTKENPHPRPILTTTQLRSLADQAIQLEGSSPLTADELVAMCLVESGGNPNAVGDGGRAVGLFQFHPGTWRDMTNNKVNRHNLLWNFMAAIRYAKRGEMLWLKSRWCQPGKPCPRVTLWMHHNSGNVRGANTSYARKCEAQLKALAAEEGGR